MGNADASCFSQALSTRLLEQKRPADYSIGRSFVSNNSADNNGDDAKAKIPVINRVHHTKD